MIALRTMFSRAALIKRQQQRLLSNCKKPDRPRDLGNSRKHIKASTVMASMGAVLGANVAGAIYLSDKGPEGEPLPLDEAIEFYGPSRPWMLSIKDVAR
ncbi:Hypothetical predicted protein [Lecanosticta acicola]|uniref:Uncharacterized protein n=1 Tax=Lecanosticta acicola TaxID=111012 RepID=A0AAI8YRY2_9PEZI|nr:Hypothetical predicted protein [Lecanosticta acicola]